MMNPRDRAYAQAAAAAMEDDEIDALCTRLLARADSQLTEDVLQQRTDLRIAAFLLHRYLRDSRDKANEGDLS
jgi:hypothetical protein